MLRGYNRLHLGENVRKKFLVHDFYVLNIFIQINKCFRSKRPLKYFKIYINKAFFYSII